MRRLGEVDVEHHLPWLPRLARLSVALLAVVVGVVGGVGVGVEVEGELLPGQGTDRLRPADVERLGGAECLEGLGAGRHGGVEVERVGHVEGAPHVRGALQGGLGGAGW